MNKKVAAFWLSMVMVLSAFVIVDVIIDITPRACGTTLYVNETGDGGAFTSIQDAINWANDGDTVYVYNGTYYENLIVNIAINLTGESRDNTIIEGGGSGDIVFVNSNWVNITGFTFTEGNSDPWDAGILLMDVQFCKIIDNNFTLNNYYGIHLDFSSNNTIKDNIVSSSKKYGIYLSYTYENNITGNTMIENGLFMWGDEVEHWNTHNITTSNTVNGMPLYYWKNRTSGTIPMDAGQVILANCTYVNLNNQVITNSSVGILLGFSTNNSIINNNVSNDNYSILLGYSNWNNIRSNNVTYNNLYGIILEFSYWNNISGNNVSNNAIGTNIWHSHFNNITNNTVTDNYYWGIVIGSSSYNNMTGNDVSRNGNGTYLLSSSNNTITNNMVTSSDDYGINLSSSYNNSIYHNNFIGNSNQAYDDTNNGNQWDNGYPSGGNFWSDYIGVDRFSGPSQDVPGNDGIGDTEYMIDGDSKDNYPLMDPIGKFILLHEGWNLISIPFIQSDTNLGTVLSYISGLYNAVQFYNTTESNDHWKQNHNEKPPPLNDLHVIDHKMGFWIYITEPGGAIFHYFGTQPSVNQTISLLPGWNMVGYPSMASYNITMGLNNLTFGDEVDSIWTHDAATQKWMELGENDLFEPGRGYWIHAKTQCEWEVPL